MAVPRLLSIFKVRPEGNLEFWVSNFVIIVSTVLGVYLAAQAGYKTALEFEVSRTQRESYFMRSALLEEFKDNLNLAEKNADYIMNKDGWRFKADSEAFKLQAYVWETMKQQSITFQLPSDILTGVRRYYDDFSAYAADMRQGQSLAMNGAKLTVEATKKIRETLVPRMEKDIATLGAKLRKDRLITE